MKSPRRRSPLAGLLLSLLLGAGLALLAFAPLFFEVPYLKEGYCSPRGIGLDASARKSGSLYVRGDWEGFPPSRECKVYKVFPSDAPTTGIPSPEETLETHPHRLVDEGSYPTPGDYKWVLIAFLLPPTLWLLYYMAEQARRRPQQTPKEPG